MINLQRKIFDAFQSVKKNKWDYSSFIGQELASLTIGIIGLGRLGNFMARYAKAFGMKVFYYDPLNQDKKFKKTNLKKLIEISDVISIHAHVNEKTKYIINKKNLKLTKKKPIIINTSRGELVKEDDIIWALKNKLISGYGADVIEKEFVDIRKSPIIKNINELYEDNRYNKNDTLFTILKYDDEIIIHGSTYLLSRHKLIEDSGIVDVADEYIHSILKNMGVPNYTWTDEYDKESSLWKFIVDSSEQTSPINLIEMLVAPNQKVTVQITDTEYGNNELEIKK